MDVCVDEDAPLFKRDAKTDFLTQKKKPSKHQWTKNRKQQFSHKRIAAFLTFEAFTKSEI